MGSEESGDERGAVTDALVAWRRGEAGGEDRLLSLVYGELHRLAARFVRGERSDNTLQPTALVHEAYLRLVDQRRVDWQSRNHFFAISARVMRRVLVDHARARQRDKRGGGAERVSIEDVTGLGFERPSELVALDEALTALEAIDPRRAAVVELRFFGGFSVAETAEILEISKPTVGRYWRLARAWLFRAVRGKAAESPDPSASS